MFFDSSVRSTRTIVFRPGSPISARSARHPLVDVRLGATARAGSPRPRRGRARRSGCPAGVPARRQHVRAAGGERVRPALGEEAGPVGAEDAAQQLRGDVVGQQPEVVRRRPRGVREVADPQVGARARGACRGPGPGGSPAPAPPRPRPPPRPARRRRPRCTPRRHAHCRRNSASKTGSSGVWYSMWWTNHSTELAMPLYASA